MANTTQHTSNGDGVTLTEAELDTLRRIVNDWVNEELVVPPYPADIMTLLQKLGMSTTVSAKGSRTAQKKRAKDTEAATVSEADESAPPLRPNLG